MRRMLVGAAAVLVCGCGSGTGNDTGTDGGGNTDYAPNFVGTWNGTLTETAAGFNSSQMVSLPITETKANTIFFVACADNVSGPSPTTTSATAFSLGAPFICPPYDDVGTCSSIVLTYTSLTGSLTGATLSFTSDVNVAGCNVSVDGTISLTAATKM